MFGSQPLLFVIGNGAYTNKNLGLFVSNYFHVRNEEQETMSLRTKVIAWSLVQSRRGLLTH